MIKNERQYKITKSQIKKFDAALGALVARDDADAGARLRKLEEDALRSQLDELRDEVEAYEQLRSGRREPIAIESFDQLPRALVQARIVAGLSQKELAERLGLKEQQIQRYEATDYSSASLTRLKEIAEALGASITGEMTYSP
jgi:ribosome-binding protein aMBF1 (putative translation factor)